MGALARDQSQAQQRQVRGLGGRRHRGCVRVGVAAVVVCGAAWLGGWLAGGLAAAGGGA